MSMMKESMAILGALVFSTAITSLVGANSYSNIDAYTVSAVDITSSYLATKEQCSQTCADDSDPKTCKKNDCRSDRINL